MQKTPHKKEGGRNKMRSTAFFHIHAIPHNDARHRAPTGISLYADKFNPFRLAGISAVQLLFHIIPMLMNAVLTAWPAPSL